MGLGFGVKRGAFAAENPYEKEQDSGGDNTDEGNFHVGFDAKLVRHSRNFRRSRYIYFAVKGGCMSTETEAQIEKYLKESCLKPGHGATQ